MGFPANEERVLVVGEVGRHAVEDGRDRRGAGGLIDLTREARHADGGGALRSSEDELLAVGDEEAEE